MVDYLNGLLIAIKRARVVRAYLYATCDEWPPISE